MNPNVTAPWCAIVPFHAALRAVTTAPDCVAVPFQACVSFSPFVKVQVSCQPFTGVIDSFEMVTLPTKPPDQALDTSNFTEHDPTGTVPELNVSVVDRADTLPAASVAVTYTEYEVPGVRPDRVVAVGVTGYTVHDAASVEAAQVSDAVVPSTAAAVGVPGAVGAVVSTGSPGSPGSPGSVVPPPSKTTSEQL